jgi:hypothetical protein
MNVTRALAPPTQAVPFAVHDLERRRLDQTILRVRNVHDEVLAHNVDCD